MELDNESDRPKYQEFLAYMFRFYLIEDHKIWHFTPRLASPSKIDVHNTRHSSRPWGKVRYWCFWNWQCHSPYLREVAPFHDSLCHGPIFFHKVKERYLLLHVASQKQFLYIDLLMLTIRYVLPSFNYYFNFDKYFFSVWSNLINRMLKVWTNSS